ncbi:polysaccharide deacetylase family protein [Clostridium sp. BJN0001]|uniref:polysaccharide deacetylase family protein n=1 Tax=Clostridium sp. BJN0001 TaxID=2930219 RepID=UPI001FD2660A|nr:polysaccharide deacetylase family protein [Clostridium sp. BJN0001]
MTRFPKLKTFFIILLVIILSVFMFFSKKALSSTKMDNIKIPVLYYHSVNPSWKNELTIPPDLLKSELQFIKDSGFSAITASDFYDYIENKKPLPKKTIMITFDDGYMDNYTYAFPSLKSLNMKATIFYITDGLKDSYYLSKDKLKEMSSFGIDIESHTKTHCHLSKLSYEKQLLELKESKEILEKTLGKKITSIAYPFGDYDENTIKAAKEAGYSLGFTCKRGIIDSTYNKYTLNRIYMNSYMKLDEFKKMINSINN